jgi:hypothetical protein
MPLPSELSTVFLGGLFLLPLLAAVYAAREIVLPVVLAFVLRLLLAPALRVLERLRAPANARNEPSIAEALQTPRQEQDDHHDGNDADDADSTVTVAVSIAAESATEAAEKEDHEKDEEDQTN